MKKKEWIQNVCLMPASSRDGINSVVDSEKATHTMYITSHTKGSVRPIRPANAPTLFRCMYACIINTKNLNFLRSPFPVNTAKFRNLVAHPRAGDRYCLAVWPNLTHSMAILIHIITPSIRRKGNDH
jgi:hypothetical protein